MKKFTSTDLGGAPILKSDLKTMFNDEIWAAIEAILFPYRPNTEGIVISGCITTDNAGNFDMTAGIVYLNGEFMKVPAYTNQTFTKYIVPAAPIDDVRTFLDGSTHVVATDKTAILASSIPGSGQYLSISSLSDLQDRRWIFMIDAEITALDAAKVNRSGDTISGTLEVDSGIRTDNTSAFYGIKEYTQTWNMDTSSGASITHGFSDFTKIVAVFAKVKDNAGTTESPIGMFSNLTSGTGSPECGILNWNSTNIQFVRRDGSGFDDPTYNAALLTVTVLYKF